MVDTDADPAGIVGDVVDSVGGCPAEFRDLEVVYPHLFRIAFRSIVTAIVLEIADQFLLLGVNRNGRLPGRHRLLHPIIDVVELRIAVRVARALERLAIGLQRIAQLTQQLADSLMRDAVAQRLQVCSQIAQASGRPSERNDRIAACDRLDQTLQLAQQFRVRRRQRLPAGARPAHAILQSLSRRFIPQFGNASTDRAARDARHLRHHLHTTTARRQRFRRSKTATSAFVQNGIKGCEPQPNGIFVDHDNDSRRADSPRESPPPKIIHHDSTIF